MNIRCAALLSLLSGAMAVAQTNQTGFAQSPASAPSPGSLANLSLEPIGPGDLLDVYVADYPAITRSYRVSPEGTITLPVLAQPVQVTGLRATGVQVQLAKALTSNRLMVDPVVAVAVIEYRSRPVNIVGAVHYPVTIQAIAGLRLLDAISKAGGIAAEAGPEIIVTRPDLPGSPGFINHISLKELLSQSDPSLNISLDGGEEVRVPIAEKLYVAGNVKMPGAYSMDQAGKLTVLQAIALCQGPLPYSKPVAVVYRPDPYSGARQPINIPLREIMKRRSPDVALLPNDILYIPDNTQKRVSMTVVERVLGFGTAVGTGVLVLGSK
jgi:polysaccharide export outer membrane protein